MISELMRIKPSVTRSFSAKLPLTNDFTLHSTPFHSIRLHYTTLQPQLQLRLRYCTRHFIGLHYTTLHDIARHSLHHRKYNCNCSTRITLHHNRNSTTTTTATTAELHHNTVVGEVIIATIAATSKKHNSNHLSVNQWIRSAILIHNN